MQSIKQTIMERDGISEEEADEVIGNAKEALQLYIDTGDLMSAQDVCEEYFGLEPDYLMELMP